MNPTNTTGLFYFGAACFLSNFSTKRLHPDPDLERNLQPPKSGVGNSQHLRTPARGLRYRVPRNSGHGRTGRAGREPPVDSPPADLSPKNHDFKLVDTREYVKTLLSQYYKLKRLK